MYRIAIIVSSDKGAAGEREDKSGPAIAECCREWAKVVSLTILPDDKAQLSQALIHLCDTDAADVIFTTGGTGFSPRDVTPEATLEVAERLCPGIPETMRLKSLAVTPMAMLSRAAAGIRKKTLIVNLPGSPKAVRECLFAILPALWHGVDILRGTAGDHG